MGKVILVVLIMLAVSTMVYADIQKDNVNKDLIVLVGQIKNRSIKSATTINNLASKAQTLVTTYPDNIDATDKTNLVTLKDKVTTAKDALTEVNDYIESTWSSIG